ncbi:TPA: DUF551 domain-containing protein [Escherichia coli]|nr:DUF551 domain-containing protein [Escherichia coli]EHR8459530.1 DUF551 domain-containing protein [Escherichia coli]HAL0994765.1 DUF551 domain-containing protein [Escherichia coli]HEI3963161.1 DUF551 domain-containing protein [Escherichia coli]
MTTITKEFTKEQLIEQAKKNIEVLRGAVERVPGASDAAVIHLKLAEITLASLEAEPIAWECGENIILLNPDTVEAYAKRAEITPKPLFAAPPVPAVPEEKPMPNPLSMLEREITQLIGDAQEATVTGYELIAEAWRLMDGQDPKTSDWHSKASKYLNSNIVEKVDDDRIEAVKAVLRRLAGNYPVIPDSWISCSERMPDKLIPVIVMYEDGDMWSAMWNGNRWDDGTEYPDPHSVTHWREMPAAPQQEVNRG